MGSAWRSIVRHSAQSCPSGNRKFWRGGVTTAVVSQSLAVTARARVVLYGVGTGRWADNARKVASTMYMRDTRAFASTMLSQMGLTVIYQVRLSSFLGSTQQLRRSLLQSPRGLTSPSQLLAFRSVLSTADRARKYLPIIAQSVSALNTLRGCLAQVANAAAWWMRTRIGIAWRERLTETLHALYPLHCTVLLRLISFFAMEP